MSQRYNDNTKSQSRKIHEKFMHFAKLFLQRVWGSGESAGGLHISLLEHTQKVAASSPKTFLQLLKGGCSWSSHIVKVGIEATC